MSQLTKTQEYLLELARRNGGLHWVEKTTGRGPRGGRISVGNRERDALLRLAARDLVRIVHRETREDDKDGGRLTITRLVYELANTPQGVRR